MQASVIFMGNPVAWTKRCCPIDSLRFPGIFFAPRPLAGFRRPASCRACPCGAGLLPCVSGGPGGDVASCVDEEQLTH